MICSCGSSTEYVHKVQKDKKVVGEFQRCQSCGRVLWLWKGKKQKYHNAYK